MIDAIYFFGAYRLEPGGGLYRGDEQIYLPPKELELLRLLVSLEGRVASHKLIESTLWPRQVVSYSSLARCVYSLRKQLEPREKNYIQNVPKRGYRLVVPLKKEPLVSPAAARSVEIHTTPLAYSHFLQGLREANNPDSGSAERAIHWYQEALKIDPKFASAYAAIADIRFWQVARGYLMPTEGLNMARSLCEQALELDPYLVSASATQAYIVAILDRSPARGLAVLDVALEFDPDYARGHTYRYLLLRMLGRVGEMLEAASHAVELDPHSIMNRHALAWALLCCGRSEEAIALERENCTFYPRDDISFANLAVFSAQLGRCDEVPEAAFEALRLSEDNPGVQAMVAYAFAKAGDSELAKDLLHQAESAALPRAPRTLLAAAYLALDARPYALELLKQARAEHCFWLPLSRVDPRWALLAEEPGFLALFD